MKETEEKKKEKKKGKGKIILRVFICLLFIISATCGGVAGYVDAQMNKIKRSDVKLNTIPVDDDIDVVYQQDVINILLLGVDERPNDSGRCDTIMIATIDKKNKRLKLTSLMRDMYIDIPGVGQRKFNASYANGGVELVYQTLLNTFGIQMDGYVKVNFEGFVEVIDQLGGVDISINDAEYNWIQRHCKRPVLLSIKKGPQTLNGDQALLYSRLRKVGNSDYERTERQRRVLEQIYLKFKDKSVPELLNIGTGMLEHIETDLTDKQIKSLLATVTTMGATTIDQYRIPVDGTFSGQRLSGAGDVLIVDFEKNKELLYDFIFNYNGVSVDTSSEASQSEESSETTQEATN